MRDARSSAWDQSPDLSLDAVTLFLGCGGGPHVNLLGLLVEAGVLVDVDLPNTHALASKRQHKSRRSSCRCGTHSELSGVRLHLFFWVPFFGLTTKHQLGQTHTVAAFNPGSPSLSSQCEVKHN